MRWRSVSGGAVDPTVGGAVEALGYDRDFAEVPAIGERLGARPVPAPGWWLIELDDRDALDRRARRVCVSTWAPRPRRSWPIAPQDESPRMTDSGALVCVGGDVSVSGPAPHDGWPVGIAVDCVGTIRRRARGIDLGGWSRQFEHRRAVLAARWATVASHRRSGHRRLCQRVLAAGFGGGGRAVSTPTHSALRPSSGARVPRSVSRPWACRHGSFDTTAWWCRRRRMAARTGRRRPRGPTDGYRASVTAVTSSQLLWYTTRATGIVALVLLTASVVLGVLTVGAGQDEDVAPIHPPGSPSPGVSPGRGVRRSARDHHGQRLVRSHRVDLGRGPLHLCRTVGCGSASGRSRSTSSWPSPSRACCARGSTPAPGGRCIGSPTPAGPWPWSTDSGRGPIPIWNG